jgi:formate-dependent nitrite reductase cytochrome c552 subunit
MKDVNVKEYLRYTFSEDETKAIAKELALAVTRKTRAEEEQKYAQAQFKTRIEAEIDVIGRLSNNINMGWDMREVDCSVHFHKPNEGFKTIVRLDTGEVVREDKMQRSELQENLFREGL